MTLSIVAYGKQKDVINCIRSIKQFVPEGVVSKIYVIDNAASEHPGRAEGFRGALERLEGVYYVNPGKNLGFGAGHNYVLGELDSEYHAIVNPDITLTGDALSAIKAYMDENPDVGMVIPRITDEDGELLKVYRRNPTPWDMFIRMFVPVGFKKRKAYHTMGEMDYSRPFRVPFGQGSFLVIRTELYRRLGGFDPRFFLYMEDADLCRRVNEVSKLMYFPGASVVHRWERGSHKSLRLFTEHVKSMIKYFRKWKA
ncbi:MAG: glycosyltransferase family 2 protein [Eubacterium sp.]|nr:glycosyltransferase family 2 protein [Eubacterium sp.]